MFHFCQCFSIETHIDLLLQVYLCPVMQLKKVQKKCTPFFGQRFLFTHHETFPCKLFKSAQLCELFFDENYFKFYRKLNKNFQIFLYWKKTLYFTFMVLRHSRVTFDSIIWNRNWSADLSLKNLLSCSSYWSVAQKTVK